MKKILCMLLALVMCAAMLTACGPSNNVPSNPDATSGDELPPAPSGENVPITDKYTFTDPAELDYDARYVLYMGPSNQSIQMSASSGLVSMFMVLYAKEEKPLGSYTFYVCDTAASAQANAEGMKASNNTVLEAVEGDDTVMFSYTDGESMEFVLSSIKDAGVIPDTNASSFADYYVNMLGAVLLK